MKKLIAITLITIASLGFTLSSGLTKDTNITEYTKTIAAEFDVVFADLQDTIINKGLVIDYVGNVDNMLERTSGAAESVTTTGQKSPYLHAKYLQFCSSKLTHKAVSADPQNLAICPYIFFIYETRSNPGNITVGYRPPVFGPSKRSKKIKVEVLEFLQGIVDETTAG